MRHSKSLTLAMLLGLVIVFPIAAWAESDSDASADAERPRIRLEGVRLVLGMVVPENAENAFGYGLSLDLGSVIRQWVHLSGGFTRWSADIDRAALGSTASGKISDTRFHVGLGLEPVDLAGVRPYVRFGVALHRVGAEIGADPSLENALAGTNFGAEFALGAASTTGAFRLSAEARREFVADVDNWSFFLGVGPRWGEKK